ncbi:MAG: S1C family serine protease [Chitinophagaceae bacterium]|nr:S1C family serine protease [Chitinophagaceae bacterium]
MDQKQLLEITEQYLKGELSAEEKNSFEEMRSNNTTVDQFVVEHQFFTTQLDKYADLKRFKANLYDIHHTMKENGEISDIKTQDHAKIIKFWGKYRRTIAVAASIAGITALLISGLTIAFSPKTPLAEIEELRRKVSKLEVKTNKQDLQLKSVRQKIEPGINVSFGGSSFLIDTKGYLVTSAHVVNNAERIFVQNSKGEDLMAEILLTDTKHDLAILKITDEDFKPLSSIPYSFNKKKIVAIAEPVFTLGFPKDEIVYGEGYLSSVNGLLGDTMSSQITIPANPGNSGGPVLNSNCEVIGILNARQTTAEGVVFATKSKYIFNAIDSLKSLDSNESIRLSTVSNVRNLNRVSQVSKIQNCVYMVKVVLKK